MEKNRCRPLRLRSRHSPKLNDACGNLRVTCKSIVVSNNISFLLHRVKALYRSGVQTEQHDGNIHDEHGEGTLVCALFICASACVCIIIGVCV